MQYYEATATIPHENKVFSWLLTSFSVACKSHLYSAIGQYHVH